MRGGTLWVPHPQGGGCAEPAPGCGPWRRRGRAAGWGEGKAGASADKAYAFEELVAELGSTFLCGDLEITNTPRIDDAQYLASWLTVLKND